MLSMDPQILLEIDEGLTSHEVAQLKFLCIDVITRKRLESVSDAKDLFSRLDEQGRLEDELLIPELLITIGRFDLLVILGKSKKEVERDLLRREVAGVLSPYRKMLCILSNEMTEENLQVVKFFSDLPKAKLEASSSFLDIIIEMEKLQRLGEDNLDELHKILDKCDRQLANRIKEFKNKHRFQQQGGSSKPLQEVSNHNPATVSSTEDCMETVKQGDSVIADSQVSRKDVNNEKDYYTVNHRPVGYCLIINNYNFEMCERLDNRDGTNKDKDELMEVFKKMHFKVEVQDDLTASGMVNLTKEFSERDHSQMDVFACCVLSHGEKGTVLGIDGQQVKIRDLTQPFVRCQSLAGKPKLFFIQACQGKQHQFGWMVDGQENVSKERKYEADASKVVMRSIPIEADFLIGMATVEQYLSYRHKTEGTVYIQELCKQLLDLCPRQEDILSILTKVNYEVSMKQIDLYKQMPEPRYTLTKKLVLPMDSGL